MTGGSCCGGGRPVGDELAIRLLGPVQAWSADHWVRPGPPRQCLVLGVLALRAGQVVPAGQLVDVMWDGDPPRSARNSVQVVLTGLRKVLSGTPGVRLARYGEGYRLEMDSDQVDVHQFRSRVQAGRASPEAVSAVTCFEAALTLWRGPALADAAGTVTVAQIQDSLAQERLAAVEDRLEAMLRCGRAHEAAAQLPGLVADYPLRERLAGLLMLALYRTGCRGEALGAYHQARLALVGELGVEPGEALQRMHQRILAGDPRLAVTSPQQRGLVIARHPAGVPHQLPAVVSHFAGREAELAELASLRPADPGSSRGAVVISAVAGMAGVGKTALAVQWCHQVAAEFPDGQLYINLRGFGPDREPVEPASAIRGFLDALGVRPEQVPENPGAQAGLYRGLLAGRRVLLLLDNAQNEAQVRPLLPASSSCLVVVTSRTRLTGLAASEGARLISLDVVPDEDARQMLGLRLGDRRITAEQEAVTEVIALCGRLPLALAIIAARAADRPDFPLADLAGELRERQRLGALDTGDTATSIQAVFSWSYEQLSAPAARMFRLLGLWPGPDIPEHAAAQVAGLPAGHAHELLRGLVRSCLLTEPSPGRYAFHDLLRAYAGRQAETADSLAERRAALTRLFDHYLALAGAAMDTLGPGERHERPRVGQPGAGAPPVGTPDSARAWLNAERANLVAAAAHTATWDWPRHTTALAAILFRYLDDGGHYSEGMAVHTHALHAATRIGDRAAQADALRRRSGIDYRRGHCAEVAIQLAEALSIYRGLGDRPGQARTLNNLGIVLRAQGNYREALNHHRQALILSREEGEDFSQAMSLDALGNTLGRLGHYQESAEHHQQALLLFRKLGEVRSTAFAAGNLAVALRRQGRLEEAREYHQQGLSLNRQVGCRPGEAEALHDLGLLWHCQGHYQVAADHHLQALELYQALGTPSGEAAALNGLGEAMTALHQPVQARAQHNSALGLLAQVTDRYQEARAHDGLAHALRLTGETGPARSHWERALALYAGMGLPEAGHVHLALQGLPAQPELLA
jgi:DNA-binding SARP family transcriptional activator/tetratricopeptide (TPR) repeat protein